MSLHRSPTLLSALRSLTQHIHTPYSSLPRTTCISASAIRTFSSTPSVQKKDEKKNKIDPRITLIRYHMQHPQTPRPLRLSRMRALRHWTIHRAWMLVRRAKKEKEEGELMRMYQSMHSACEELRTMDPPTAPNAGRLYRIAMEKKGIFGKGGVPIEYARFQTDTPAKEAWNHGWTR
ncbi:uncharacterized protein RCO7_01464 [Rhynchosporium graminicola]|uniref:Large ribosomal subunit protein mL40 n=1 Tax=Rhynchosporium graminicola TaxID=2792576 RepID=A0A1E1JZ47_9HELO|nr:uncharacterized protein RCO7_01464 [Rhynchosporium commune]